MRCRFARTTGAVIIVASLAACGSRGTDAPNLMNIRSSTNTPDEFGIMPTKPIELPSDMAQLPPPTPGGGNRTDIDPRADAIAALGGRPERASPQGQIPGADSGLVNYSARFGRDPGVRAELAEQDLEYRQNNRGRPLERWAGLNVYFDAYEDQALDQHRELQRVRGGGVRSVSAPPDFQDN